MRAATRQAPKCSGPSMTPRRCWTSVATTSRWRLLHDDGAVDRCPPLNDDGLGVVHAPSVILATGGLGHLYSATTNPEGSTGDGIALAMWAGLPVPISSSSSSTPRCCSTGMRVAADRLITEAVRGEGAILVDSHGRFGYRRCAPDGGSRTAGCRRAAIDARMTATGDPCVYLDARAIDGFAKRFPTVTAACRDAGIDPTRQPIPVVPGAHYSCGGVVTDVHGRTELAGPFAAGEVARTGMHGANRLASNSLLEGLVVGGRAGRAAAAHASDAGLTTALPPEPAARRALPRADLQRAMTRHASVVRDDVGLRSLSQALEASTPRRLNSRKDFEDVALTTAAGAVMAAALARTETRGCHHRADCPDTDPAMARSLVPAVACA